jgi:hypothetical protein
MPYETNRDLGLSSGAFDQIQHSTGAALAFGSPIERRDQASDARLLQETEEENGKEVSAQPSNLHPAQPDDIAIRDLVAKLTPSCWQR